MRKNNLNYLVYSILFLVLAGISVYREEKIALVTSVIMSLLFAAVYFVHKISAKRGSFTLRTDP